MRPQSFRRYDQVFRESALALVERSNRAMTAIAEDLGVPPATLRYWYKQAEMAKKGKLAQRARKGSTAPMTLSNSNPPSSDQERIAQLEREVAALQKENEELKMDRAILKKAAAFFAKESE